MIKNAIKVAQHKHILKNEILNIIWHGFWLVDWQFYPKTGYQKGIDTKVFFKYMCHYNANNSKFAIFMVKWY